MINTNLKVNQIFKNYKEICEYLGEPVYQGGKQRQLQLKDWERYFSYKKEGYKFIITEVFETPKEKIDKRSNGNRSKYVEPFMNYVMSTFDEKYLDEYFTISNWTVGVLKLLDKEICNSIYKDDDELLKYCSKRGIIDTKLYRKYISTVKSTTRNLVIKTFGWLQKRGYIEYQDGYKFIYEGDKYNNAVTTHVVNDVIDKIERDICQTIIENDNAFHNKNIKGKQLIYILQHSKDKDKLESYIDMRIKALNASDDICSAVNDAIWEKDACSPDYVDGEIKHLLFAYKCYKISTIINNYPKVYNKNIKQDVINIIKDISLTHMINIKYKLSYDEEYHPYDNKESLLEIEKINKILFKKTNRKVTSISQDETQISEDCKEENFEYEGFDFEELDEIFPIAS